MRSNKKKEKRLTVERLKQVLEYNVETGLFVHIYGRQGVKVGKVAGTLRNTGHLETMIDGDSFLCHRLAWFYCHGFFPVEDIDHIDGNPSNNRLLNLREVSRAMNCRNQKMHHTNTSGKTGVTLGKVKQISGKIDHYWLAWWQDTSGKSRCKSFSVLKYGESQAKELAILFRGDKIRELNAGGSGYSDNHGHPR